MVKAADIFIKTFSKDSLLLNEPMCRHTTFQTGGPADILFLPESVDQIKAGIEICRDNQIPYYVIGRGSNLLVKDAGFEGVIIKIAKNISSTDVVENRITAQAGVLLSSLSSIALSRGLKGLEFASGIPGTVGGAVYMNAGAYDGEISNVIKSACVVNDKGEIAVLDKKELQLGYRTSRLMQEEMIVLSADFVLEEGDIAEIRGKMADFNRRRREKQPVHLPSAGSTFKRPEGYFAGKLIMDAGLRGHTIGGAQVSELHCGFIVNKGNATTEDILALIQYVQDTVYEKSGVKLEPEVRILG